MINRHSILFKLNIIFIFTIVSISIIFFAMNDFMGKKARMDLKFSIIGLQKTLDLYIPHAANTDLNQYIAPLMLEIVDDKDNEIIPHAKEIAKESIDEHSKPPFFRDNSKRFSPPRHFENIPENFKILMYKDETYLQITDEKYNYLLKYKQTANTQIIVWIRIGYLFFITLLIVLYFLIRKNINGLKTLQNSLIDYENGVVDKTKIINGKDEVATVSKQFYKVALKLDAVNKSRKLFLRNMMHELKTPLTKSKLYLGLMQESQMRDSLELSLNKLEFLIDDMANIEKISTDNMSIEKKDYRQADIIDNAIDMLFINKDIVAIEDMQNSVVSADFKLFTIVMKNLIDNGIKYSDDGLVNIDCKNNKIEVSSSAKPLKYEFENYLEPFYKGDLNEINQRGFGLGLYIVNEIINKHGFTFAYEYKNGKNIFVINLSA